MTFSSEPDDLDNLPHDVPTPIELEGRPTLIRDEPRVDKAAAFLELLGRSSLSNTETSREERAVGRRAIARVRQGVKDLATPDQDHFDEMVAMALEERGLTFEAELRYRSITPESTTAAVRLAQLLESKGCVAEATGLYAHAAAGNNVNAIWRLAVLSHQVGRRDWATDLADLAYRNMGTDSARDMSESVRELSRNRNMCDLSGKLERMITASCGGSYALGSSLLIASGRPDLARLAYSSSLLAGDSFAANTLFSLPRRSMPEPAAAEITSIIGGSDINRRARSYSMKASKGLGRYSAALRSETGDLAVPDLLSTTRVESRGRRSAATQSVLALARTVTALNGFATIGCGRAAQAAVTTAGDEVCAAVMSNLITGSASESEFINDIWTLGRRRLDEARDASSDPPSRTANETSNDPVLVQRIVSPRTSGSVRRIRRVLRGLAADHCKIWTLSTAGARGHDGSVSVTRSSPIVESQICDEVNDRLRRCHRGEAVDQELWAAVDGCFEGISDAARARLCTVDAESSHVQL